MSSFSHPAIIVEDHTNLEPVHFTLKWSIHDFEGLKNKVDELYSPGITMAELGMGEGYRGRWRICVDPCFVAEDDGLEVDYVCVYLSLTDEDLESTSYSGTRALSCITKQRVTTEKLMDLRGDTAAEFSKLFSFTSDGNNGDVMVYSYQRLFGSGAETPKGSYLDIAIDVIVYKEPHTARQSAVFPSTQQWHHEFLGRLLKQQEAGGDFVLVSNNGKEYHVDCCLLMAHSPVFAAMLNHDSKEKLTSRCEMDDVDGECVEILMDYVYGCAFGKIQANNAEKVLAMADKYQMVDLRAICERMMANNITMDNAVQVFVLARQRNLGTLKDVAKKFISKNMDLEAILGD